MNSFYTVILVSVCICSPFLCNTFNLRFLLPVCISPHQLCVYPWEYVYACTDTSPLYGLVVSIGARLEGRCVRLSKCTIFLSWKGKLFFRLSLTGYYLISWKMTSQTLKISNPWLTVTSCYSTDKFPWRESQLLRWVKSSCGKWEGFFACGQENEVLAIYKVFSWLPNQHMLVPWGSDGGQTQTQTQEEILDRT